MMKIKDVCDRINEMPTMLAVMRLDGALRVVVSYASYDPERDEGVLEFYHGLLEMPLGPDAMPDRSRHPLDEWVNMEPFTGEVDVAAIGPYMTDYDVAGYRSLPPPFARAWIQRQRLRMRKGELTGSSARRMTRRIRGVEDGIRRNRKIARHNAKLQSAFERELGVK